MLVKTDAFVLSNIKYGESSSIVRLFTKDYGIVSFIVNGIYSKNAIFKPSYLLYFSHLSVVAYLKPNREIQRIKEVAVLKNYNNLHQNPLKMMITTFASEAIQKIVGFQNPDLKIYNLVEEFINKLDFESETLKNYPVNFFESLLDASGYDFQSFENQSDNAIFLAEEPTVIYNNVNSSANKLNKLIDFAKTQLPDFVGFKSVDVLRRMLYS